MTISVEKARKLLDKNHKKYSDKEILELIENLTVFADLIIDFYIENKKKG